MRRSSDAATPAAFRQPDTLATPKGQKPAQAAAAAPARAVLRAPPSSQAAPLRDVAAAVPRAALTVSAPAGTALRGTAPRAPLHLLGGGVAAGVPLAAVLVAVAVAALGSAWLLRLLPGRAEHCGSAGAPPASKPPSPLPLLSVLPRRAAGLLRHRPTRPGSAALVCAFSGTPGIARLSFRGCEVLKVFVY